MQNFTFTITDPEGFHARPAGMFVKLVKKFPCRVTVRKDNRVAEANKMFSLMGLGIKSGETVAITIEGEQETEAAALQEFLKTNL